MIRPDIAGIMGAFGAALIARERYEGQETSMLSKEQMETLEYSTSMTKCHGCTNNCRLTINKFSGGRRYISGNRCERGLGKEKKKIRLRTCSLIKMNASSHMNRWQKLTPREVLWVSPRPQYV